MPDVAQDAQALKRAADAKKQLSEAKNLLLRYRGLMAEHALDVPSALDRQWLTWMQQVSAPGENS